MSTRIDILEIPRTEPVRVVLQTKMKVGKDEETEFEPDVCDFEYVPRLPRAQQTAELNLQAHFMKPSRLNTFETPMSPFPDLLQMEQVTAIIAR